MLLGGDILQHNFIVPILDDDIFIIKTRINYIPHEFLHYTFEKVIDLLSILYIQRTVKSQFLFVGKSLYLLYI